MTLNLPRLLVVLGFMLFAPGCATGVPMGALDEGGADGGDSDTIDAGDLDEYEPPPAGTAILYVARHGSNESEGDEPSAPLRTIQYAIQKARLCEPAPCEVHIASGEYDGALTLVSGVHLRGSYQQDFSAPSPAYERTFITSDAGRTVRAEGLRARTELGGLTIRGADWSALNNSSSSFALYIVQSEDHLHLVDVVVEGGRGARGAHGRSGAAESCDARGGRGGIATGDQCQFDTAASGSAGGDPTSGGAPGGTGSSQNCGNATCPAVGGDGISNGASGSPGGNGGEGMAASPATNNTGAFDGLIWSPPLGIEATRGRHGTGGGGGGAGGTKRIHACFGCSSVRGGRGGDGGAGGCGGGPGESGAPGGASFAIFIAEASVHYTGLRIVGGVGGDGGDGGEGHSGLAGSADGSRGREDRNTKKCGAINYHSGAGAHGGAGGAGGAGGSGAGGAGGPAFGVVTLGSGTRILPHEGSPEMNLVAGQAGRGGRGAAGTIPSSDGPDGRVAHRYSF